MTPRAEQRLVILIAACPAHQGGRHDSQAAAHLPTICCTIETSTGASSASAYPISAARIDPFARSCAPGSPPASR